jgi:hypothetical protein
MPTLLSDVRCWVNSGKHLLAASISEFDPQRSSATTKYTSSTGSGFFQASSLDGYTAAK